MEQISTTSSCIELARTPGDKKTIKRNALNRRECEAIVRSGPTRLASFRKLFHGGRNRGSTSSRAPTLKNEHRETDRRLVRKKRKEVRPQPERNVTRFLLFLRFRAASWRGVFRLLLRESVQTSERNGLSCEKEEKKAVTGGGGGWM